MVFVYTCTPGRILVRVRQPVQLPERHADRGRGAAAGRAGGLEAVPARPDLPRDRHDGAALRATAAEGRLCAAGHGAPVRQVWSRAVDGAECLSAAQRAGRAGRPARRQPLVDRSLQPRDHGAEFRARPGHRHARRRWRRSWPRSTCRRTICWRWRKASPSRRCCGARPRRRAPAACSARRRSWSRTRCSGATTGSRTPSCLPACGRDWRSASHEEA
jgi:hypothetical protein